MRQLLLVAAALALASADGVLVLGSGGLVGRAVVRWLSERGHEVLEVRDRRHIDLRERGALDAFNRSRVAYCVFLACEVGGSKFIDSSAAEVQRRILTSNLRIYQTVLPWLQERRIPFLFTSSYLQATPNAYGAAKRLGEQWVLQLGGLGRILRLWNVYGEERVGPKSHVLADWAEQCARRGFATSLTDGREERQFVHANDTAAACGLAMRHHEALEPVSDVSSGRWTTLRSVAQAVRGCPVRFSEAPAAERRRLSPQLNRTLHLFWAPRVSLAEGVAALFPPSLS